MFENGGYVFAVVREDSEAYTGGGVELQPGVGNGVGKGFTERVRDAQGAGAGVVVLYEYDELVAAEARERYFRVFGPEGLDRARERAGNSTQDCVAYRV